VTRIKICGITQVEQALAAAAEGADYIGLVFAASRRKVTGEKAAEICGILRSLNNPPAAVGVFVNLKAEEVNNTAVSCGLDYVQLSGDETWEYCRQIRLPVIKALHVSASSSLESLIGEIKQGYAALSPERLTFLLDTQVQGFYGGTGQSFDLRLAQEIAARYPVIIAGGLDCENIRRVVREVRPWGVDVSSGVETGGIKDIGKIKEFIRNVRGCPDEAR
jgi:phosphoribosylanthranilate isomerase